MTTPGARHTVPAPAGVPATPTATPAPTDAATPGDAADDTTATAGMES